MIKLWSRSCMLRSTLVQSSGAIYAADWSPTSTSVVYGNGHHLCIKPLQPNSKTTTWRAHDGLILCAAWSSSNKQIVSSAEDCRYRVWDGRGQVLFSSQPLLWPVTSLCWDRDGQLLALGSHSTLRLTNSHGWSHSLLNLSEPTSQSPGAERASDSTGSASAVMRVSWSPDGTQLVAGCTAGHVILSHVTGFRSVWRQFEIESSDRSVINVKDCLQNTTERLDFQDNVILISFKYQYLVALTSTNCCIYNSENWNTPSIVKLKHASVHLILQSPRLFALCDLVSLTLYTYDGRVVSSPRWPGLRPGSLTSPLVALSDDTLAVTSGDTAVYIVDCSSGKSLSDRPYTHTDPVTSISLNQQLSTTASAASHRLLALLDISCNVYLLHARRESRNAQLLAVMCTSMCWSSEFSMLATVQENRLCVWLYPAAVYIDKQVLPSTVIVKETPELSRGGGAAVQFDSDTVLLRGRDGGTVSVGVSPYAAALHRCVSGQVMSGQQRWTAALTLCRFAKMETLWSSLAAMACGCCEAETARSAYAAIGMIHKVEYLDHIIELSDRNVASAEFSLLLGNVAEAESALIKAGHPEKAVSTHIQLHNWQRALDLVVRHKLSPDLILSQRQQYLQRFGLREDNKLFTEYKKMLRERQLKQTAESIDDEEIPESAR